MHTHCELWRWGNEVSCRVGQVRAKTHLKDAINGGTSVCCRQMRRCMGSQFRLQWQMHKHPKMRRKCQQHNTEPELISKLMDRQMSRCTTRSSSSWWTGKEQEREKSSNWCAVQHLAANHWGCAGQKWRLTAALVNYCLHHLHWYECMHYIHTVSKRTWDGQKEGGKWCTSLNNITQHTICTRKKEKVRLKVPGFKKNSLDYDEDKWRP